MLLSVEKSFLDDIFKDEIAVQNEAEKNGCAKVLIPSVQKTAYKRM